MHRPFRNVISALAAMFVMVSPLAADTNISEQLLGQFPLAVRAAGLDSPAAGRITTHAATPSFTRGFTPARFDEPFRLESSAGRVVLRPFNGGASAARRESAGIAYRNAFRGTDVLRAGDREVLVVNDAASLRAIAYQIVDTKAIDAIVADGRGMRFLSLRGDASSQLAISAPLVVDAKGRASFAARWVVENAGSPAAALRLELNDARVTYPVAVTYAAGARTMVRAAEQSMRVAVAQSKFRLTTLGTGAISGNVTDAHTGFPLEGVNIDVYDSAGEYLANAITDGNGNYRVIDLDTNSYRVVAVLADYTPELYSQIDCIGCDVTTGTPVNVTDGSTTTNINFTLASASTRITGTVRDAAGNPLEGVTVAVYDASAEILAVGDSLAGGGYQVLLPEGGTYYARTLNQVYMGFVDQLYSGSDCTACNPLAGTPIVAGNGAMVTGIDFSMKTNGGRFTGRISDGGSGAPIPQGVVTFYTTAGDLATFAYVDGNGDYVSWHGLSAGDYFLLAEAEDYVPELHDNVVCRGGCAVTSGTPETIALNETRTINFGMANDVASVSGSVFDSTTSAPLSGVHVQFYDGSAEPVIAAVTNDDGTYSVVLPNAGTYYARTMNTVHRGYTDVLYNGRACSDCDPMTGDPIVANAGSPVTGVDFPLTRNGGTVAGRVTNANAQALPFAQVLFYDENGVYRTYGLTDENGNYSTFSLLSEGNYFAVARADGYSSELYDDIFCDNGCDPTSGTAIAVTNGGTTADINFQLATQGCAAIAVHPISLPGGTVNSQYSQTISATGGAAPYVFAIVDGALPPGLTLDGSTGVISGTLPAAPDAHTFIVQATDGSNCSAAREYTIEVTMPTTSTVLTSVSPTTIALGESISMSASVTPSNVTGTVTFFDEGVLIATATLSNGTASASGAPVGAGTRAITAYYGGDENWAPSTSEPVYITVNKTDPEITWATPAPITYPTPIEESTLNATANVEGTFVYTPAAGTILDAGNRTLSVTFTPDNTDHYNTVTRTVTQVVLKANQTITWANPASIVYGTPLGATQLNATVSVPGPSPAGGLTYAPAAGTILDAGTHSLNVTAAETLNYHAATASVTIVVTKANQTISWATPANIVYGTPLGAAQLNATVSVPGPSAAGALTYTPAAGTILNAGTHTLSVAAAATNNYNAASASVSLTVLKASPVFSNLSAPTIVIGTASTVISGKIAAGALIPPGNVTITLGASTQTVAIAADGTFSATFATGSLQPATPGHAISFSYAGSANFNAATGSSLLIVRYGFTGGTVTNGPFNAGSVIPMRIKVVNASNQNLSAASLTITPVGIAATPAGPWSTVNTVGQSFEFSNAQGGSYAFNVKTTGLTAGTYVVGFRIGNDPTIHTIPFTLR